MPDHRMFSSRLAGFSLVFALAAAGSPALATEPGWYIGFSGGRSDIVNPEALDDLCADVGITCGDGEKDTGFKVLAGYQINSYMGLEGAYFDIGQPSLTASAPIPGTATADLKGGSFSVLPQIPIGNIGAIFGRLGFAGGDVEVVAHAPLIGRTESASATGGSILVGAGGAVNLGRNVTVRVEWERYAINQTLNIAGIDFESPDVDFFSGTVIIRFPRPR